MGDNRSQNVIPIIIYKLCLYSVVIDMSIVILLALTNFVTVYKYRIVHSM